MNDFKDTFLEFYRQFCREKPILESLGSMNSSGTKELREFLKALGSHHSILTRLDYIRHREIFYELEDIIDQFQNLSPMALQEAMNCFNKPNDKERFSSLVCFLRSNINLFAQLTYYSLLLASNSPTTNCSSIFSKDDVFYFCFSTFPSIFSFFMIQEDQDLGIQFIIAILKFHLYIHGPSFGLQHKFISYLISSFFSSTNPSTFFESSLRPSLRGFSGSSLEIKYKYTKDNNGCIVRSDYWHQIINLADFIITNMVSNATLLPRASRKLITEILKIQDQDFPFAEVFVIDAMILDYLEKSQIIADQDLMHDVCNVIRCTFPESHVKMPLRASLSNQQFLSALNIQKLAKSFEFEQNENEDPINTDPIGKASAQFDKVAYISPRGLSLLYLFSTKFLEVANKSDNGPIKSLEKNLLGLENLKKTMDNKFMELPLKSAQIRIPKTKNAMILAYNDIISSMEGLNIYNLNFSTPEELSQLIIKYNGINIPISKKVRLQTLPEMAKNLDGALKAIKDSTNNQRTYGINLFIATHIVETEKNQIQKLWAHKAEQAIKEYIVPLLFTKYNFSFNYNIKDPLSGRQLIEEALTSVNSLIPQLSLPKELGEFVRKAVIIEFLDLFDSITSFQALQKSFDFKIEPSVEGDQTRISQASQILGLIKITEKPTANLSKAIEASRYARTKENIINAIIRSQNSDVFGFALYYSAFVSNPKILSILFTKEDIDYIKMFIDSVNEIRKNK